MTDDTAKQRQALVIIRRLVVAAASFAFVTFIASAAVKASEQVDICALYVDTGRSYHVTATAMYGSELNGATHSLNYNMPSRYVVIFWAQNQASIIDMGPFSPSYIGAP